MVLFEVENTFLYHGSRMSFLKFVISFIQQLKITSFQTVTPTKIPRLHGKIVQAEKNGVICQRKEGQLVCKLQLGENRLYPSNYICRLSEKKSSLSQSMRSEMN